MNSSTALFLSTKKGDTMKHLGSALLLGIMLAMVLVLAVWVRTSQQTGQQWNLPLRSSLQQLEQLDDQAHH